MCIRDRLYRSVAQHRGASPTTRLLRPTRDTKTNGKTKGKMCCIKRKMAGRNLIHTTPPGTDFRADFLPRWGSVLRVIWVTRGIYIPWVEIRHAYYLYVLPDRTVTQLYGTPESTETKGTTKTRFTSPEWRLTRLSPLYALPGSLSL